MSLTHIKCQLLTEKLFVIMFETLDYGNLQNGILKSAQHLYDVFQIAFEVNIS